MKKIINKIVQFINLLESSDYDREDPIDVDFLVECIAEGDEELKDRLLMVADIIFFDEDQIDRYYNFRDRII